MVRLWIYFEAVRICYWPNVGVWERKNQACPPKDLGLDNSKIGVAIKMGRLQEDLVLEVESESSLLPGPS